MACGVPPIVSDLPAVKEWVQDDVNGYVVPARKPDKLAEKIKYLMDNKEKRRIFIKRNQNLVNMYSDFDHNMALLENIYINLLQHYQ